MDFKDTRLWKCFEDEASNHTKLIEVFDGTRKNTEVLVGETRNVLPNYTVHDVGHLDALWAVADQVIGSAFQLNPLEAFVLGGAFLFHDAGMALASYPDGMPQITESQEWRRLLGRNGYKETPSVTDEVRRLLEIFLREQHAARAEDLPHTEWKTDQTTFHLMADADHRLNFGALIGKIAASHHWPHEELEATFTDKFNAPMGYPAEWQVDPLKLACILRCADAANIDQSRAPSFLWALQQATINDYSNMHWTFQTRMIPAKLEGDALRYSTHTSYTRDEAKIWWMAYDTMAMVDRELRACDQLLARHRGDNGRLAARRVLDIDSPEAVTRQVQVTGWSPVDTSFTINDIPKLVEKLGGAQLYGDNKGVAIRELIMNGMDAVRVRRKAEGRDLADAPVTLTIAGEPGAQTMTIEDQGIGLDSQGFVKNLLGFGSSGWMNDPSLGEIGKETVADDDVYGQFGIGFFSVFMLGKKVKITSRRWDSGPKDTVVMEFQDGLNERPVIYPAAPEEKLLEPGTRITVEVDWGDQSFKEILSSIAQVNRGLNFDRDIKDRLGTKHLLGALFPTSDVLLQFQVDGKADLIDGRAWETEDAVTFLERCHPGISEIFKIKAMRDALFAIKDDQGNVLGRVATLVYSDAKSKRGQGQVLISSGSIVCKGAVLDRCLSVYGIVKGQPSKASRDQAVPVVSPIYLQEVLVRMTERILADPTNSDKLRQACTSTLMRLGKPAEDLPFAKFQGRFLTRGQLKHRIEEAGELWAIPSYTLSARRHLKMEWVSEKLFEDTSGSFGFFVGHAGLPIDFQSLAGSSMYNEAGLAAMALNLDWWDNALLHRGTSRHVMTDEHGKQRFAKVTILKPNMTKEEFLAINTEII